MQTMKKKILVVDDEQSIRLLLENYLNKTYEVFTSVNGEEGLIWLEKNIPSLIICDNQKPVMDVYEVIRMVRYSGFHKQYKQG